VCDSNRNNLAILFDFPGFRNIPTMLDSDRLRAIFGAAPF
jgi:hypothetical protein